MEITTKNLVNLRYGKCQTFVQFLTIETGENIIYKFLFHWNYYDNPMIINISDVTCYFILFQMLGFIDEDMTNDEKHSLLLDINKLDEWKIMIQNFKDEDYLTDSQIIQEFDNYMEEYYNFMND